MFKLLIADDEKLERDALKFIISKSIDSIVDIEEAVNGREAITKAQVSKPDIIILDINMPGINGIEAAWKIREKDETVAIIFLTAFHQFDYAHEAIKVGVEDYIVKPSSEQRIIDVLEKVTGKLQSEKTALRERETMEIRLDRATDYLSSEFIYNLATRTMDEDKFYNYLTLLDLSFQHGRGVIMKMDYETYPILVNSDYQKHILKKRAMRLMKNALGHKELHCAFNMDLNNIFILIFSGEYSQNLESIEKMQNIISSLKGIIKNNLNMDVFIGIGPVFATADRAVNSFTEAKKSFSGKENRPDSPISQEDLPLELEMNMEQAVISANRETTEKIFQKIEEWLQNSTVGFDKKKNAMKDLSAILRHAAASQFPDGNCSVDTNEVALAHSLSELQTAFKVFLNELMDMMTELFARENIPSVKKACQFIQENYHRDLSLEETAKHCHLSTFYFSKIFKENKKQNFINYLTELRINEAKRLLKETDFTMKEISSRIGYNDPNYFTRVFKRVENCSPSDFRSKKMLY